MAEVQEAPVAVDISGLSDGIKAAIAENHVKAVASEVEISEKASPTGKKATKPYIKLLALDARGMAALCGGKLEPQTDKPTDGDDTRTDAQKAPGAADYFNYGFDLEVRARERAALMGLLEGPEKAIKKAVDSLVANTGMDAAMAREFVVNQRQKAGLAV